MYALRPGDPQERDRVRVSVINDRIEQPRDEEKRASYVRGNVYNSAGGHEGKKRKTE